MLRGYRVCQLPIQDMCGDGKEKIMLCGGCSVSRKANIYLLLSLTSCAFLIPIKFYISADKSPDYVQLFTHPYPQHPIRKHVAHIFN